ACKAGRSKSQEGCNENRFVEGHAGAQCDARAATWTTQSLGNCAKLVERMMASARRRRPSVLDWGVLDPSPPPDHAGFGQRPLLGGCDLLQRVRVVGTRATSRGRRVRARTAAIWSIVYLSAKCCNRQKVEFN